MRSRQQRLVFQAELALTLQNIAAGPKMKFGSGHGLLKFRRLNDASEERIGVEQYRVVKKDIVNTDDFFLTQHDVRCLGIAFMHGKADAEVRVVIEVSAGGNHPVDESRFD